MPKNYINGGSKVTNHRHTLKTSSVIFVNIALSILILASCSYTVHVIGLNEDFNTSYFSKNQCVVTIRNYVQNENYSEVILHGLVYLENWADEPDSEYIKRLILSATLLQMDHKETVDLKRIQQNNGYINQAIDLLNSEAFEMSEQQYTIWKQLLVKGSVSYKPFLICVNIIEGILHKPDRTTVAIQNFKLSYPKWFEKNEGTELLMRIRETAEWLEVT